MRSERIKPALGLLCCPVCQRKALGETKLTQDQAGQLRCTNGHCFDLAKAGQLNLTGRQSPANADTGQMVQARAQFLATGLYQPIADLVSQALVGCQNLVEVGAGTGYYLRQALAGDLAKPHVACDISPAAARCCANTGLAAVVCDTWQQLPIASATVSGLLCVFAPRNFAEFARVLAPGGKLIVIAPNPDHLFELRKDYQLLSIADDKANRIKTDAAAVGLYENAEHELVKELFLTAPETELLIQMGPNAFHQKQPIQTTSIKTQISVTQYIFEPH